MSNSPTHEKVANNNKKSDEVKFWRKLVPSWGVFIGRKGKDEEPSAIINARSPSAIDPVTRGAQVPYLANQRRTTVCSNCSMDMEQARGISSIEE